MDLINTYCHWKIELTGPPLGDTKNVTTSKMYILGRSAQKLKNHIFALMTTFYDFALKIETSWAKMDVKPSLETWNVNDVIVYVWYIYSQIKKIKNMECKQE